MPWCPNCRLEYREDFTKCSDCDADLVEELENDAENQQEYDVEAFLISVANTIEASILEAKLGEYDIPVLQKSKEAGGYLNIYMGMSPYGVDLYVPSKLLDKAKEIIRTDSTGYSPEMPDTEPDLVEVPITEADKAEFERKRQFSIWVIAMILIIIPFLAWLLIGLFKK